MCGLQCTCGPLALGARRPANAERTTADDGGCGGGGGSYLRYEVTHDNACIAFMINDVCAYVFICHADSKNDRAYGPAGIMVYYNNGNINIFIYHRVYTERAPWKAFRKRPVHTCVVVRVDLLRVRSTPRDVHPSAASVWPARLGYPQAIARPKFPRPCDVLYG